MKGTLITLIIIFNATILLSQSITPKRDFRGAWVATVTNLDWPSSRNLTTAAQQEELISLFNELERININAVIFQIRTECDALYDSPYEPWSYWLTGAQGKAPNPYYDPLEFAIEEAHKRGLELHAWFNPYRAEKKINAYTTSIDHVTNLHPDWVITIGDFKFLNPGLPEVRDYVNKIVADVATRYDVDGVHFDDYFYPYPPNQITTQDQQTFSEFPRGFTNIGDWRRDNVNELLRMISDTLKTIKPHVKFGMSPFGIYRPENPPGISGLDAYNTIYCDALAWIEDKSIDYLSPQLYWPFSGGQDYGKLLPWWASKVDDRHLYPGQALYRAGSWPIGEVPRQIRLNRATTNTYGNIFFRAQNLFANPNGTTDSLTENYYKNKALLPQMSWKDNVTPNNPTNLRYAPLADVRGNGILWDAPSPASDGDTASMYVVYQLNDINLEAGELENTENIWKVLSPNYTNLNESDRIADKMYFAVTALDKNYNESAVTEVIEVEVTLPEIPLLVGPEDNAPNTRDTTILSWNNSLYSTHNNLQVSNDTGFTDLFYQIDGIVDTFKTVTGLDGLTEYFWRVSALNIAGETDYSEIRKFRTGFPNPPALLEPADKLTEVELNPLFVWNTTTLANEYQIQIAEGLSIEPSIIIFDTLITDTTSFTPQLNENKIYTWHVRAKNEYGFSKWSEVSKFKTQILVSVDDQNIPLAFSLEQNYPNPFNPETNIEFSIVNNGFTTLKVYDILGREVKVLVNEFLDKGNYKIMFDGSDLSSGIYIYSLNNGSEVIRKKMLLLK
jgi:uncharacterized lipoprotein YddW (UPF0748 family)